MTTTTTTTTGYELLDVRVTIEDDQFPDVSWLDGSRCDDDDICRQWDSERLQAFQRGDWHMTGVCTRASVLNRATGRIQTIYGGALWGIESDSGREYYEEVTRDCLGELADELAGLGLTFTADELAYRADWYE